MRSHMAPSWLVWKLTTSAPSSRPRSCSWPSICSSVMVPYCLGSRLPNMLWLMPCSMRIFIACLSVLLESGGDQGTSKKFDRVAAGGRAGDGFGHPQVGQAVARTHQRGRSVFPAAPASLPPDNAGPAAHARCWAWPARCHRAARGAAARPGWGRAAPQPRGPGRRRQGRGRPRRSGQHLGFVAERPCGPGRYSRRRPRRCEGGGSWVSHVF